MTTEDALATFFVERGIDERDFGTAYHSFDVDGKTGQAKATTCKYIEECKFCYKDTPVLVTLSCGAAEFSPNDTLEAVFERADQTLYRAKGSGRNCVCGESPSAQEHASVE